MPVQQPSLRRTEGDSLDPIRMTIEARTGLSTTEPTNLTGSSVTFSIFPEGSGTALSLFDDVTVPAPDIVAPLAGKIDYVLSAPQVAELVPGRYGMKVKIDQGGKTRGYPNDTVLGTPGVVVTRLILLVVPV